MTQVVRFPPAVPYHSAVTPGWGEGGEVGGEESEGECVANMPVAPPMECVTIPKLQGTHL